MRTMLEKGSHWHIRMGDLTIGTNSYAGLWKKIWAAKVPLRSRSGYGKSAMTLSLIVRTLLSVISLLTPTVCCAKLSTCIGKPPTGNSMKDWALFLASHLDQSRFELCLMLVVELTRCLCICPQVCGNLPELRWSKPSPGFLKINVDDA
ncbi:hypothetical protein ACFX2F_038315 [Malus domestica]